MDQDGNVRASQRPPNVNVVASVKSDCRSVAQNDAIILQRFFLFGTKNPRCLAEAIL